MTQSNLNHSFRVIGFINQSHVGAETPPNHLPDGVRAAFEEATRAFAIGCWNAAGCMFRVSIDLATKEIHSKGGGPDRLTLSRRLNWLFDNTHVPSDLRDLATCINDDGNDAAHIAGLNKEDAEDLLDFSRELLRRIYTEPARVKKANERRKYRRDKAKQGADCLDSARRTARTPCLRESVAARVSTVSNSIETVSGVTRTGIGIRLAFQVKVSKPDETHGSHEEFARPKGELLSSSKHFARQHPNRNLSTGNSRSARRQIYVHGRNYGWGRDKGSSGNTSFHLAMLNTIQSRAIGRTQFTCVPDGSFRLRSSVRDMSNASSKSADAKIT